MYSCLPAGPPLYLQCACSIRQQGDESMPGCVLPQRGSVVQPNRIEEVPLTVLAQHRKAPSGPKFSMMQPHAGVCTDQPQSIREGDKLDLHPEAGLALTRWNYGAGLTKFDQQLGHADATITAGFDSELTAWCDYNPKLSAVRPSTVQSQKFEQQVRLSWCTRLVMAATQTVWCVYCVW